MHWNGVFFYNWRYPEIIEFENDKVYNVKTQQLRVWFWHLRIMGLPNNILQKGKCHKLGTPRTQFLVVSGL